MNGEGIPWDSSQWKRGVFVVVFASTDLIWRNVPRDPMCGLYIIRKGHDHEAIYNFVKETETCYILFVNCSRYLLH